MILHGKDLQILTPVTGGTAPIVAASKSCEIEVACELIEKSSPDTGQWKTYTTGRKSWSVNVGYLVTVGDFHVELLKVGTEVTLNVTDVTDPLNFVTLTGSAFVKTCRISATRGNIATGTFQFQGNGELSAPSE